MKSTNMKEYEVKIVQMCLICNESNQVLVLQRGPEEKKNPYLWDLPGGKVELYENNIESIKREVLEETGQKISKFILHHVYTITIGDIYFFIVIYKSKTKKREIKISEEHSDYKWIKRDEIDKYEFNTLLENKINKFL